MRREPLGPARPRARRSPARPARPPGSTADFVWLDGRIVPAGRAVVSAFDRGFLYGDAFFETIRAYDGRLFLWEEHLRRLGASLRRFAVPRPAADLRRAATDLLAACGLREAAIRLTVTRGVGEGLAPPPGIAPTVLLTARAVAPDLAAQRQAGVAAIRLPFGHGQRSPRSGHKSTDYLAAVAGRMLAGRRRAAEALFVEADGCVSEGTTSNLFVVRGGTLRTPPLEAGCLPGITRQHVLAIARRAGLEVRQTPVRATSLASADELFVTGTVIEILPVVRLDGHPIADAAPGPVTRHLQELYRRFVARTLARPERRPSPCDGAIASRARREERALKA